MNLSTLPSVETRLFGLVLAVVLGAPVLAHALTLANVPRYLERASCGGQPTVYGADDFGPETIFNNGIDCYSEAATGSSGTAMQGPDYPLLEAPWARSILNTRGENGGVTDASVFYRWGVGVLPGGVAGWQVPVIIHSYLAIEFDGSGVIRDLAAEILFGAGG